MGTTVVKARLACSLLGATFGALLIGCAGMGKDQCLQADWQMIGYEDGLHGRPATQIGTHRVACAKHQVTPDLAAYTAGRNRGLQEYCQPKNGFHVGLNGWSYANVCPSPAEPAFVAGYRYGRQIHDARSELRSTQARLRATRDALAQTAAATDSATAELILADVPTKRRLFLAQELVRLADDRHDLEIRLNQLTLRTHELVASVKDLESQSPYGF